MDDDDVTVETVDERQDLPPPPDGGASGPTKNSNPDWLIGGFYDIVDLVQSNGWILLVLAIALWFLKRHLEDYLRQKRRSDEDGMHARDPDKLLDLQLRRGSCSSSSRAARRCCRFSRRKAAGKGGERAKREDSRLR